MKRSTPLVAHISRDFVASITVFLVALPLCLGVAKASDAPFMAGIIAGIVGGIVVGLISKSHTSVAGPAAGLTAVVSAQIAGIGSFEGFLAALVVAGVIQFLFGVFKCGFIAEFFPSSVIKGLLTAIGIILILKQLPHLVGHDPDPDGEMSFFQPDNRNTFTELIDSVFDLHSGSLLVGIVSMLILMGWDRIKSLKSSLIPAPLVVVICGCALHNFLKYLGEPWDISICSKPELSHLVQVPVITTWDELSKLLTFPDFSFLSQFSIYKAAVTIAIVASLETLLNLEAVDKIDPQKRRSPPSRELTAQGVGNFLSGIIGGIPVTSVIVRSTVNINSGARSKLSTILHGVHMLVFVLFLPGLLNQIPLSCLAAILIMTGWKLAHPHNFVSMWKQGRYQFLPFIVTIVAIIFTDLLIGILIGLVVSIGFILRSNLKRPMTKVLEKHISGDVFHIRLANQVSFLNKAVLGRILEDAPDVKHLLIDARDTDYVDPDILEMIHELKNEIGPARGIQVSLIGFQEKYQIKDVIQFVDYSSQELREQLTPDQVIEILKEGNERFYTGNRLSRDLHRQISQTAEKQYPMAVILGCIDSRAPTEIVFDLGVGDIFTIRIAGNVAREKVLGSMEFACHVAGAKLVFVMGHTSCGAVSSAVDLTLSGKTPTEFTGCEHLDLLLGELQKSVDTNVHQMAKSWTPEEKRSFIDMVARRNVEHTIAYIKRESNTLSQLEKQGKIKIIGGLYNISSGKVDFLGLH
ncbi:MAG: bifunctional SulP family inorganic anion transporter/carbonic anhydrase [Planctomycetia bacterium]|nr:bifunctional SulP family inorganic anion transporter/carbonic anhydrase [Planctomycetia bacterium]